MKIHSKIKKFLVAVSLLSILIQSTGANFFVSPKVFAEDGTLTMRIRANTGLLADPSELVKICEGCSLEPGT